MYFKPPEMQTSPDTKKTAPSLMEGTVQHICWSPHSNHQWGPDWTLGATSPLRPPPCLLFPNACLHKLNTTAPRFHELAWDSCARRARVSPEEALQTSAEAGATGQTQMGQGSAGVQESHTHHSCLSKSKTVPETHGGKPAGNIMAGQRLQMPRKLLMPAVLAMGTAISATHTGGNEPPPHAIHKQL